MATAAARPASTTRRARGSPSPPTPDRTPTTSPSAPCWPRSSGGPSGAPSPPAAATAPAPRSGSAYARLSYRDVLDLCIVGVATCVSLDADQRVTSVRFGLGSVAARPVRAPRTEAFLDGKVLTDDVIAEAGRVSSGDANPITDQRASAEYRRLMMPVLTRRSLTRARDAAIAAPNERSDR